MWGMGVHVGDNLIESRNLIINDLLSSDKRWWEFWK